MPLRLSRHTAPAAEPVHLNEAKIHLRLAVDAAGAAAYTAEDAPLSAMIAAAREVAEFESWKALVLQGWDLFLDSWPAGGEIRLPYPPLRRVESIQCTLADGTVTTLAATEYEVDADSVPGRVVLGYGKSWPAGELAPKNPIRVRFWAGYAVPFTADLAANALLAPDHPFIDGDKVRLSVSGGALPAGLAALTDYFVRDVSGSTFKLAATADGAAVDLTTAGTGTLFVGEVPPSTTIGIKLLITDFYEERGDTARSGALNRIPRAASHHFAMDSAREF